MLIKQPMLAVACEDLSQLQYPVYATPKLDGIRALMVGNQLLSRKWKPIANTHIRTTLESILCDDMDGELLVVKERDENGAVLSYHNFNTCSSGIMRESGEPDFVYMIFDYVCEGLEETYHDRMEFLRKWFAVQSPKASQHIALVDYTPIDGVQALTDYTQWCIDNGFEGAMVRSPESPYKCGRSTLNEGWLLKIKRFHDAEARVIGFVEQMRNDNEKQKDAFGRTKRSTHKANKVGKGTLGALVCTMDGCKVEFEIGTGFDNAERQKVWDNSDEYMGKMVKFKYQDMGKDAPRFPVFLGWRHEDDL